MRLEKAYIHQLIRVLRLAIPIIVVALVAVPVWNYWDRPEEESFVQEAFPKLLENMEALQQGFKFAQTVGERTSFTIEARTTLEFTDGTNLLEDVTVTLFGDEGYPERRIRSDRGGYDEETEDIRFEGNVKMQLDENTVGHTAELVYAHRSQTVESREPVIVRRPGQFEGRADRLKFLIPDTLIILAGRVRLTFEDGPNVETAIARFHQRDSWVQVFGGVEITSSAGLISGAEASAQLEPETFRPISAIIAGDVHLEFQNPDGGWVVEADALHATFSTEGMVRAISARGTASLQSRKKDNPQSLFGNQINAVLDETGRLQSVEAVGAGRMVLGEDEELRSEWIRNELSGLVTTTSDSFLRIGQASLAGSYFEIERAARVRFRTRRPATLKTDRVLTTGDRTDATFDLESGQLVEFIQSGNVRFDQQGRVGTAGRVEISASGDRILLGGRPMVSSDRFRVEADSIVLDQGNGSFSASGNARTVLLDESDPVLIVGTQVQGNAGKIVFSEAAELWRDQVHVRAPTIEFFPEERRFLALGGVDSTIEDIRANANRLEFVDHTGVVHYAGNVQIRSDKIELRAGDLEAVMKDGEAKLIVARQEVVINGPDFGMKADEAVYDQAAQTITLYGREAEVSDLATGTVQGRQFVLDIEDNGVVVNGEDGSLVVSRKSIPQR